MKDSVPKLWKKETAPAVFTAKESHVYNFFFLMGRVARAHGRVTEEHIAAAKWYMEAYIGESQHELAREAFRDGKEAPDDRRNIVDHAFELYFDQNYRWLEPFQILDALLRLSMSTGSFSAREEYVIDEVRKTVAVGIRPYWLLRDTLSRKFGIELPESHFADAKGQEFDHFREKVRSDTFGKRPLKPPGGGTVSQPTSGDREGYLAALELRADASEREIRVQYRKLVKQYHPDTFSSGGAEDTELAEAVAKFCAVQEAYRALTRESA